MPQPPSGRTFRVSYRIRLSDADASGRLRLDAIARYLQDAAIDDVEETGLGRAGASVGAPRRCGSTCVAPFLDDSAVDIVTWGSSFSSLAAGRRWSLLGRCGGRDRGRQHLDPPRTATPARRASATGFDGYAEAAQGRVASTKLTLAPPPLDGTRVEWPLRATDVDRMGHVNNAAYWAAIEQRLVGHGFDLTRPLRARLDYRHPIDLGERVELAEDPRDGRYGAAFLVGERRQGGRLGRRRPGVLENH